jgi:hypothetical protein
MPIEFQIEERLGGFTLTSARKDEKVAIIPRALLGPQDTELADRLDGLQGCLFSKIPNLPTPPRICDLIVIINHDLMGRAFVDELPLPATVTAARPIEKGEAVFLKDISGIEAVHLDVHVPDDAAIVVIRSFNWKRSLFFDFGPLHNDFGKRTYNLEKALGQQMTLLFGLPSPACKFAAGQARLESMKQALDCLVDLLANQCDDEDAYQELLASAPWMLGASYSALLRHKKMDDLNIPDFTALRAYDECHDVVELKQPFLRLFRADGHFNSDFNDAWNQAERYLDFCQRQRTYLLDQKQLRFENPRCILLIGHNLSVPESSAVRAKESASRLITVITYDQLYRQARHFFEVVVTLEDRTYPSEEKFG